MDSSAKVILHCSSLLLPEHKLVIFRSEKTYLAQNLIRFPRVSRDCVQSFLTLISFLLGNWRNSMEGNCLVGESILWSRTAVQILYFTQSYKFLRASRAYSASSPFQYTSIYNAVNFLLVPYFKPNVIHIAFPLHHSPHNTGQHLVINLGEPCHHQVALTHGTVGHGDDVHYVGLPLCQLVFLCSLVNLQLCSGLGSLTLLYCSKNPYTLLPTSL